jgi:CubicO group peptidase (beta-lactamase class C family)
MNDLELKELWRNQDLGDGPAAGSLEQSAAMREKLSILHKTLKRRNAGELVSGVVVALVFGVYFFVFPQPLCRIGSVMIISGVLFSSWKLLRSNRQAPRPDPGAPVALWLKQERDRMHHEAELLRTVLWWYILPIGIGTNVFFWGIPSRSLAGGMLFTGVTMLLYFWIYRLNQSARREKLLPVQAELEALLQMESDPESGSSHSSDRPHHPSAERRTNYMVSGLILTVTLIAFFIFWRAESMEALRPPGFEDISAFSEADISRIDGWLHEEVTRANYPSLSVAIVRGDAVVYQRSFGYADIGAGRKATPETSYHVASVTKAFTASMAAILHARGVIDLDRPVASYLPTEVTISDRPKTGARITLRQLASHTSGLPRGVPGRVQSVEGKYQLEPGLLYEQLAEVTLESEPGTAELYSNLGFGLLGHALERAAGMPFERLLQETICDPLQLEQTAINERDELEIATGYSRFRTRRAEGHSYRARLAPSGGLITSAADLAKFLSAQLKPGFFTGEMLEQLHAPTKLSNGSNSDTALGWTLNFSSGRIIEKNGGRNNCSAWIGFSRDHGIGVAVLTNCGESGVEPIGRWLLERSVPGGHKPVMPHGYAKVAPYTGVRWKNDRPTVQVQGRWVNLVSIDGIPIEKIVDFAEREFAGKARKRFAEDLVYLLSSMGHNPDWEVTLGFQAGAVQIERLKVRMTEENRRLVRE